MSWLNAGAGASLTMFEVDERQRRNVVDDDFIADLAMAVFLRALLACMRQADLIKFLESMSCML